MLTWLCECGVKHVDDHEPLRCCACDAEWNPLRASRDEVDRYSRTIGLDPDALRAEGRALAKHLFEGRTKRARA